MPGFLHVLHRFWDNHHHHGHHSDSLHHAHLTHSFPQSSEGLHFKHTDKLSLSVWEETARKDQKTKLFPIIPGQFTPGSMEDHHFQLVQQAVLRTIPHKAGNLRIDEVQYVVNPHIEQEFNAKAQEVGGQVLFGFHGTREANIKNICKENFRLSRCKSVTPLGEAVWFSMDPLQSLLYVPDEKLSKKLILAKIITGDSFKGLCHHACDECIHGQKGTVYDTVIDGNVIIVMESALILPCYVVSISEI